MSLSDADLKLFASKELTILAPAYLRQQKGLLVLRAPKSDVKGRSLELVTAAIHVIPDARMIMIDSWNASPKNLNWQGQTERIERRGPVDWIGGGFEVFSCRTDGQFAYGLLFGEDAMPVEVRILGRGDRMHFEALCRQVILSVRQK
jgi:hypothetical protein